MGKLGAGIKDLEQKILAAKSTAASKSGIRRDLALREGRDLAAQLKREQAQFDVARAKITEVRKAHSAARKAAEDAKIKCEECGEFKLAHAAAQEIAIAKARAVELAKQVPKDAEVIRVDDKKAEAEIIGKDRREDAL